MEDKKIKLSVDDTRLKELKSNAEAMALEMISNSRKLSTSSKEVLKDIEAQIKAIERRNKIDNDYQMTLLRRQKQSGALTGENYSRAVSGQSISEKEDKLQTELLREVIAAIQQSSKNEIRENRVAVEERIRRSETVNQLNPTGISPREALRETVQRGDIGDISQNEAGDSARFRTALRGTGAGINRVTGAVAGAQNELYLAAAALGVIPIIGMGLSAAANRVIGSAGRFEQNLTGIAQGQRGVTAEQAMNRIKGISDPSSLAKSGLTYADLAQGIGTFKGQTGNRVGDVYALKMLEAEKALGIDRGTMGGLAGIMRYSTDKAYSSTVSGRETVKVAAPKMKWTVGGSGVGEIEKEQDRKVGGSGVGGVTEMLSIFDSAAKGNRAIMKEMVNTFQQASQNILAISGKIGMRDVASGIASIAAGTGTEGQQLGRVVAGVQGLGQSGNPVIRSMMLRSLRQSNPNASFFDLQAMMENPLESGNIKTTQTMFDSLKKMTGGGELYKQALYSTFGGTLSRTDLNEIIEGGGDFTKIAAGKESAMKTKTKDFGRDNSDIVGKLEQSSARIESFTQDMGKQLVDYIDKSFDKIIEKLKEYEVLGPEVTSSVKEGTFKALEAAHNAGMLGGMK